MTVQVQTYAFGPLMTNAYLIWDTKTKKGVVIDPGAYPVQLINEIKEKQIDVEAILLTHAHFDHIGGIDDVYNVTAAPVYIHELEAEWLTNPDFNGSARSGLGHIRVRQADNILRGEESLTLLGRNVDIFHTPGHSPGSISYYFKDEQVLVSGDVLFQGSIGRTDLPGGDYETLMDSIRKLIQLPGQTNVLPGHGPATTIAHEQQTNPFLGRL